jgi:hypothetical protein
MTVSPITISRKNPPPAKKSDKNKNQNINNNVNSSSVLGSLIDGVTFGAGSSIGHGIVNKVSSYFSSDKYETTDKPKNCDEIIKKFEECKNNYDIDMNKCSEILSIYEKCK